MQDRGAIIEAGRPVRTALQQSRRETTRADIFLAKTSWLIAMCTARIDYKPCLLEHKTLLGHTSAYIADLLTFVADIRA